MLNNLTFLCTNLSTFLHKDGGLVLGDNCPDCEGGIGKEEEKKEEEAEDQGSHLLHSNVTNRLFVDGNHLVHL